VKIINKDAADEPGLWRYAHECDDPHAEDFVLHRRSDGWARLVEAVMDRIAEAGR